MVKLSILFLLCAIGAGCSDLDPDSCLSPETAGVRLLSSYSTESPEVEAALKQLELSSEDPKEFYVRLNRTDSGYSAELWHESAFYPANCRMVGNPGGLNRTYLIESGQVVEELGWK